MAALQRLASVDAVVAWVVARGVQRLVVDSRQVGPGDGFIAWPGYAVDGRQFVASALQAGAVAALVEDDGVENFPLDDDRVASLPQLKARTGEIASRFQCAPSNRLEIVACTGTNGKTSMAWWTAQALTALGRRCGLVGTLGIGEPPAQGRSATLVATGLTTPDPVTLQAAYRRFADAGVVACAIEASSIGLVEGRLAGSKIDVALFSNFTQDHLDFHGSMEAYWLAKAQLFAWPGLRAAVLNVDDHRGAALAITLRASGALDVWTYSAAHAPARLVASDIGYQGGGLRFVMTELGGDAATVEAPGLIGAYNVSNLLAVVGGLRALGVPLADAARVCAGLTPVPGRMQRVVDDREGAEAGADDPEVVVDYAHTPDALEKALLALQPFALQRGGWLACVFGCGGNRDAAKRPLMGAIAARLAQRVVVTSDNPRDESPAAIVAQVMAGATQAGGTAEVTATLDRAEAIATAIATAGRRDVILIAGKGHEDYQEVAGTKHPFADAAHALAALRQRPRVAA